MNKVSIIDVTAGYIAGAIGNYLVPAPNWAALVVSIIMFWLILCGFVAIRHVIWRS